MWDVKIGKRENTQMWKCGDVKMSAQKNINND